MYAELPRPVRYALLVLALVIAVCVLCWVDDEDDKLVELHVRSRVPIGTPLFTHPSTPELASWRVVLVPALQVDRMLAELDDAFVAPVISLPTSSFGGDDGESCPITTPRYDHLQGYLAAAPEGIDAGAAWRRGARGAGVWFADIEGGWNTSHEDLPGDRIALVHGKPMTLPGWREHGTAVLGEVVGIDNGKGVTGIAPDVDRVITA